MPAMRVSFVIPAWNEEKRLPATLEMIRKYKGTFAVHEVIVVDDGSADCTSAIAESWKDRLPVTVIRLAKNRGKGAALRAGVLKASGEYVLLYDADGATRPTELDDFARIIHEKHPDIIIGSRLQTKEGKQVIMSWYRRLVGRTYHALCWSLIPGIVDAACGFKLLKKEIAHDLFSRQQIDRFAYDIEILHLAMKSHYSIVETPVEWTAVPGSKVNLVQDSLQMLWSVLGLYLRRH